jgi:hypothetical protein
MRRALALALLWGAATAQVQSARADCAMPPCPGPPTLSDVGGAATAPTTGLLAGTIATNGLQTTYHFHYFTQGPFAGVHDTPSQPMDPGVNPLAVSVPVSALVPGATYTLYLYASNSDGPSSAGPFSFSTPELPAVGVSSLQADQRSIEIGEHVTLTASLSTEDPGSEAILQAANAPFRRFRELQAGYLGAGKRFSYRVAQLDRNTELRVELTGYLEPLRRLGESAGLQVRPATVSVPVRVYVQPSVRVSVARGDRLHRSMVEVSYEAQVHSLSRYDGGQTVYFYRRDGNAAPFSRFASARLKLIAGHLLDASAGFIDPGPAQGFACVRGQLLSDMGTPFLYRACGHLMLRL